MPPCQGRDLWIHESLTAISMPLRVLTTKITLYKLVKEILRHHFGSKMYQKVIRIKSEYNFGAGWSSSETSPSDTEVSESIGLADPAARGAALRKPDRAVAGRIGASETRKGVREGMFRGKTARQTPGPAGKAATSVSRELNSGPVDAGGPVGPGSVKTATGRRQGKKFADSAPAGRKDQD